MSAETIVHDPTTHKTPPLKGEVVVGFFSEKTDEEICIHDLSRFYIDEELSIKQLGKMVHRREARVRFVLAQLGFPINQSFGSNRQPEAEAKRIRKIRQFYSDENKKNEAVSKIHTPQSAKRRSDSVTKIWRGSSYRTSVVSHMSATLRRQQLERIQEAFSPDYQEEMKRRVAVESVDNLAREIGRTAGTLRSWMKLLGIVKPKKSGFR